MSDELSSNLVSAARELLRLKDLKTDAEKINTSGDWAATARRRAMLEEHEAKKGEAWDALRRALQDETKARLCPKCNRMVTEGCQYVACPYPPLRTNQGDSGCVMPGDSSEKT